MSTTRLKQVALPSGAVVTFRPLRAEEINLVVKSTTASQKQVNAERAEGLFSALQNCTVEVSNPGPYGTFVWSKATDADHMAGIFALRSHTFGVGYDLPYKCGGCGHKWPHKVRFTPEAEGGDLRVFPMHDDARAALARDLGTGLLPPKELPSGTTVVCRVISGAARKEVSKIVEELSSDPFIGAIRARIVKMTLADGTEVETNDLTQAVRELDASDLPALQEYLAEMDGGVDDWFTIPCPECGHENEEQPAPFLGQAAFWGLSAKRRKPR